MYDAVIVGAGLAGLTAAARLGSRKVLVLEKENHCGGRVLTRQQGDVSYELGALFASPLDTGLPAEVSGTCPAVGRIGLHVGGRWIYSDTPLGCMRIAVAASPADVQSVNAFAEGKRDARQLGGDVLAVLNAFFHLTHPAPVEASIPARQRDALAAHAEGFRTEGNGSIVSRLLRELPAPVMTGAEVVRVEDEGGWVRVEYIRDGQLRVARSKAVVMATPPQQALAAVRGKNASVDDFLGSVQFLPGRVCAVGVRAADVTPFNYLVATDLPFNTVVQCRREDSDTAVLHVYYVGEKLRHPESAATGPAAPGVVDQLVAAGVLAAGTIPRFVDSHEWSGVGPAISVSPYGLPTVPFQVTPRIFLAGDYTWFDKAERFPFGMKAAVESGRRAADAAMQVLGGVAVHAASPAMAAGDVAGARRPFPLAPLVHSTVYELGDNGPVFLRHIVEGNIAYYGLVLQATGDARLAEYLVHAAVDDLWEFHTGFGVTAADSALVMEGLLETHADPRLLARSARRLVEVFYSGEEGAFATVVSGRAAYWLGVSTETTAHVAWLLQRIDAAGWREQIERSVHFVQQAQQPDGHWEGKWFPSHLVPTYYAVRLLLDAAAASSTAHASRARDYILRTQLNNGSWSHLVIDTAVAILALRRLGGADAAIERATAWLHERARIGSIAGEPVLYYWYDAEGGRKTFFCARDAGSIARAWATLAVGSK